MAPSARLSLAFSCVGHACIHLFTAFFFVIVLALEEAWERPYHELVELWTLGALLVGVAALPAGWLGDRWSASGMMTVFFVGMGACSVLAGFAGSPSALLLPLAGIGLFAAIYHPVGIPWLLRHTDRHRGKVLAVNGVFGSLGAALAGLVAGSLIDLAGWRAAFVVPGIVCVLTGLALWLCIAVGRIDDQVPRRVNTGTGGRDDMARVFVILVLAMFVAGVVYHSTQTVLPKLFAERHEGLVSDSATGIGLLVAVVYTVAGAMQLVGGYLADRFPLKIVYLAALILQVPFLWLAASLSGVPLLLVTTIMVTAGVGALPAENMLLARYAPARHHGVAFGIKFVLVFAAAPLSVQFVSLVNERTGGFQWVFTVLAIAVATVCLVVSLLPRTPAPRPATAPA